MREKNGGRALQHDRTIFIRIYHILASNARPNAFTAGCWLVDLFKVARETVNKGNGRNKGQTRLLLCYDDSFIS